jgi:hypothetical protein
LDSVFKQKVHVFLNYKDIGDWCQRHNIRDLLGDCSHFRAFCAEIECYPGREYVICIKRFDSSIESTGTLIHECVHCIMKIWASSGVPFSRDNEEFLATGIGDLCEQIAGRIKKS